MVSALKISFFVNLVFRYCEALDVLLGSILALLRPLTPKWPPKWTQDGSQNQYKTCPNIALLFDPILAIAGQLVGSI